MAELFTTILYQPVFNLLVFLYNLTGNLGLAIIILTVAIKILLWPLSAQATRAQKQLQAVQPKIEELKKRHKDKREEQAKALMELYHQEKINPLSSCLPVLIQLPLLIAVFQVFRQGLKSESLNLLYPFITNPGSLNSLLWDSIDLATPNVVLAVLAGLAQFWQTRMLMAKQPASPKPKSDDFAAILNKQMLYMMPILTVFIGLSLPSGLALYWLVFTLLTIGQQRIVLKEKPTIAAQSTSLK